MLALTQAPAARRRRARPGPEAVKLEPTGTARLGGVSGAVGDARDRGVIARIAASDRAALKELYLLYHRRLARFLTRITSRYDLAEEIINDTFWGGWERAGQFRGASYVLKR